MTIDSWDFCFRTNSGTGFSATGATEETLSPRFGLVFRVFDVLALAEVPLVSGFPHPAGGLVILGGVDGGCTNGGDTKGFPQPGGAFFTPTFDARAGSADSAEGFPHPGGAVVTPILDAGFAFGVGTSLAV